MNTSKEAKKSISPARLRAEVLRVIKRRRVRGATCDEVEVALGLTHQSASPRITELKQRGLIESVSIRNTRSGRPAYVWAARRPVTGPVANQGQEG